MTATIDAPLSLPQRLHASLPLLRLGWSTMRSSPRILVIPLFGLVLGLSALAAWATPVIARMVTAFEQVPTQHGYSGHERLSLAFHAMATWRSAGLVLVCLVGLGFTLSLLGTWLSFALTHQIIARLKGRPCAIRSSLAHASSRPWDIVCVGIIGVGVVHLVEGLSSLVGDLLGTLIPGWLSWLFDATFFAIGVGLSQALALCVPVMINERIGLRAASRRIPDLLKRTAPTLIAGETGLWLVASALLILVAIAAGLLSVALFVAGGGWTGAGVITAVTLAILGLTIVLTVTIGTIFTSATYLTEVEGAMPTAIAA